MLAAGGRKFCEITLFLNKFMTLDAATKHSKMVVSNDILVELVLNPQRKLCELSLSVPVCMNYSELQRRTCFEHTARHEIPSE